MNRVLIVGIVAIGCSKTPGPKPPMPNKTAPCNVQPLSARPAPSNTDIQALSHGVLDAFDRGDANALAAQLSDGFLHFEGGAPTTKVDELAGVARRKPNAPHIDVRTWKQEHIDVRDGSATFFGLADEHMAGNEVHGGYQYQGWYALTWLHEGGDWKLAVWTWQRAGAAAERDSWNDMYRNGIGFNKLPNKLLVETVSKLPKRGAALDVAMGQGRNALYLAEQGWRVTGVDFSDEGVRQTQQEAVKRKLSIDVINADLATYDFGIAKWDLVTLIYANDDVEQIKRIKASLRKGGVFVVEYFHDNDDEGKADGSFAKGELRALFADGFDIVKDEIIDGVPDWAMNQASLVRFVARKR
jgi:SAM-dependent methyltransferase